jgi:hypothetical protein
MVHWPFHNRKVKGASMEDLGNILPRVLKKHARSESGPMLAVLAGVWPRAAGKAIAQQARPLAFSAGILTLAVACPNWAVQLNGLREEIRSAINKTLGRALVRQVRVKLVRDGAAGVAPRSKHEKRASIAVAWTEPDIPALAGLDPELREIVSRSYGKYFARSDRKVH